MITIPMTRAEFAAKAVQLQQEQGVEIAGDSGVLTKDGYSASYIFNGSSLQVEALGVGFIKRAFIEARIKSWLAGG